MEKINLIVKKVNDLFITVRYKYIKQNKDGSYITFNKRKNENHSNLHDGFIKSHLLREGTYGVFCSMSHSKFITFDVDVANVDEARRVVRALCYALNSLGIPAKNIFVSWSGSKGYHVDIYFSAEISNILIKKLYDTAVLETYNLLNGSINGQIELRPTPTQGVKLPLSINLKNKDTSNNVCWYIDVNNNFTPIYDLDYFLTIEQIDAELAVDLINDIRELEHNEPVKKEIIKDFTNIDLRTESPNSLASLYKNGLKKSGIRNTSLCKLAVYFNTLKVSKNECEQRLKKWMDQQDSKYYKTPLETCYKEIKRIVNSVYKNNITLSDGKTEIVFSRSEMLTIYQYPKKFHRTINALLIHAKRFGDKDGQFFMTYEQISVASKSSMRTAIAHIKQLEAANLIIVTRTPKEHLPENHPNTYQLNLNWLKSDKEISVKIVADKLESYVDIRTTLILKTFPNNEWWNLDSILKTALKEQI